MGSGGGGGMDMGAFMGMLQAQQARQMEEERQQRITKGREAIDKQFEGLENNKAFYQRYKDATRDYYKPQIDRQYADARNNLTYQLADAGTLRSSAAADATADLMRQNDAAIAQMNAKMDSGAADLRTRVAANKDTAINQLMATESPDAGMTSALNSIQNISLAPPSMEPLANIFNQAAIGGANAIKSWRQGGGQLGFGGADTGPTGGGNTGKNYSIIGG